MKVRGPGEIQFGGIFHASQLRFRTWAHKMFKTRFGNSQEANYPIKNG